MSREELYNDIVKKLDIIKNTESMVELDKAHISLRMQVECFALAHRRRLNFETDHYGYPKKGVEDE